VSNPYRRKIPQGNDGLSDVYDVLVAFGVTCPATQHALKKLLLPGVRTGGKSRAQDVQEAIQALQRAVELAGPADCPPKTPRPFDAACTCTIERGSLGGLCCGCGHPSRKVESLFGEPPITHH
jgi:hypothetical protein